MPLIRKTSPAVLRRMASTYTPQVVAELQRIEADLGGRAAMVGLLALAPLTQDLEYVLGMLGDPAQKGRTLAEICARGGILPGDLLGHLSQAALLRGKILASQRIGMGMAAVVEDIMRRAAPYTDACGTCMGIGTVTADPTPEVPNPAPEPCSVCRGSGQMLYRPDLERQKLAMDLAHLLPKSAGIQIAQINSAGQSSGVGARGSTFDAVQRAVDKILYSAEGGLAPPEEIPPAVEAEVVEAEPTADLPDPDEGPDAPAGGSGV